MNDLNEERDSLMSKDRSAEVELLKKELKENTKECERLEAALPEDNDLDEVDQLYDTLVDSHSKRYDVQEQIIE